MTKNDTIKKAMLVALTESLGVVAVACNKTGISRQTHYQWYKKDKKYKKAVDDLSEVALDFAESMLHSKIKNKDTAAIIFYLKTKGKKRGYVERTELTGKDGEDLVQVGKLAEEIAKRKENLD